MSYSGRSSAAIGLHRSQDAARLYFAPFYDLPPLMCHGKLNSRPLRSGGCEGEGGCVKEAVASHNTRLTAPTKNLYPSPARQGENGI